MKQLNSSLGASTQRLPFSQEGTSSGTWSVPLVISILEEKALTHNPKPERFMKDHIWIRSFKDNGEVVNRVTRNEMIAKLQEQFTSFDLNILSFLNQGGEVLIDQHGQGFAEYLRGGEKTS